MKKIIINLVIAAAAFVFCDRAKSEITETLLESTNAQSVVSAVTNAAASPDGTVFHECRVSILENRALISETAPSWAAPIRKTLTIPEAQSLISTITNAAPIPEGSQLQSLRIIFADENRVVVIAATSQ